MKVYDVAPPSAKRAFSLVELSIVLVILGLLAGGVLSGQSLIRASQLRAVNAEYQQFSTVTMTFRDKYLAIPGDIANATAFWGKDNVACTGDSGTAKTPGTCNGDGDGNLEFAADVSETAEMFQFWKQLQLAGLVQGTYTGLSGTGSKWEAVPGSNVPSSKMNQATWTAANNNQFVGSAYSYKFDYKNFFFFGKASDPALANVAVLKPEEAWNLDTKFDDGKPGSGKVIAMYWDDECAAADDGSSANDDLASSYRLQESGILCALFFPQAF